MQLTTNKKEENAMRRAMVVIMMMVMAIVWQVAYGYEVTLPDILGRVHCFAMYADTAYVGGENGIMEVHLGEGSPDPAFVFISTPASIVGVKVVMAGARNKEGMYLFALAEHHTLFIYKRMSAQGFVLINEVDIRGRAQDMEWDYDTETLYVLNLAGYTENQVTAISVLPSGEIMVGNTYSIGYCWGRGAYLTSRNTYCLSDDARFVQVRELSPTQKPQKRGRIRLPRVNDDYWLGPAGIVENENKAYILLGVSVKNTDGQALFLGKTVIPRIKQVSQVEEMVDLHLGGMISADLRMVHKGILVWTNVARYESDWVWNYYKSTIRKRCCMRKEVPSTLDDLVSEDIMIDIVEWTSDRLLALMRNDAQPGRPARLIFIDY